MTAVFLAGAAVRKITPPLGERPVFLAGFGHNRRATAVHSELYARALALRFGDQIAILVACDLIGLLRGNVDTIRAALAPRDIAPEALIVACSGTHGGPDTIGRWGPDEARSGVDPLYLAAIQRSIAEAAVEALTFGCPVRMRAVTASLPGGYIADAAGSADDELAAIQFVRPNGETLATLLNLACSPTALADNSTLISADYPGAACQMVEQALGGVALHISGSTGGPGPAIGARDATGAEKLGRIYADVAMAALAQSELADVGRLDVRRARLRLSPGSTHFAQSQAAGLSTTICTSIDLGAAQVLAVPGAPSTRLGAELKAALPGPVRMLASTADDDVGEMAGSAGAPLLAAVDELVRAQREE